MSKSNALTENSRRYSAGVVIRSDSDIGQLQLTLILSEVSRLFFIWFFLSEAVVQGVEH